MLASLAKDQGQLNRIGVNLNAINTMYDLCNMDQNAPVDRRLWTLPDYGITVDVAAAQTRFAVWGIQGMIGTENHFDFRPMVSQVVLAREIKGFVGIRHEKRPRIAMAPDSNFAYSRFDHIVKVVNATSSVSSLADLGTTNMDIHQTTTVRSCLNNMFSLHV